MRYEISEYTIYEEEDRTTLCQLAGAVRGIASEAWPRLHGRPMQHLFTIDLKGLELDVAAARGFRLLVVFAMAFYELDPGADDTIALRWVSQEELDRVPSSTPPADFEEVGALEESAFEQGEVGLQITEIEEPYDANYFDSYLGGEPAWCDEGEPADKPSGRFILQVSDQIVPITRTGSQLYLFEGGAYIQCHDEPEEDDTVAVPWPVAIAASREFVLHDSESEQGAVQKWGGVPRGVPEDEWPEGMSHVLTFEPARWPEGGPEDAVAVAVFTDLEQHDCDELSGFYELVPLSKKALEEASEPPADVPILPERRLELRPFAPGTSYFDLRLAAYEGPRLACRRPSLYQDLEEGTMGWQLTEAFLPNVSKPGTAYFDACCDSEAAWQAADGEALGEGGVLVEGLAGTLYEEETGTAVVVGHRLSIAQDPLLVMEELERFAARVKEANEAHGLELEFIVPGDTATDRDLDVSAAMILGHRVVQMEASDGPAVVDRTRVLEALGAFAPIPASYWQMLEEEFDDFEASEEPTAYLVAYGPLCYGGLCIGRPLDNEDNAIYSFARCQNMEQQPSEEGVDGVLLTSVELTDLEELSFSDEALEEHSAAVSKLDAVSYLLVCAYD